VAPKPESAPVAPIEEQHGVQGKVETREEQPVATAPATLFQADTVESTGTLPLTGFNALFQVILGGLSIGGGSLLFRRTRTD
jgi:LPXTG-motif cell wall-anchored protein